MFVEILSKIGGPPLRVDATQVLIRNDAGTPVCVAGEYGPPGTIKVAHAADPEFNRTLQAFGYGQHRVITDRLSGPEFPAGAKLVAGPGVSG